MNPLAASDPALIGTDAVPTRSALGRRLDLERIARYRGTVIGYGQILAGTGGRLALQVVYFFVLANTLSLAEMGVFASISAAGVMVGAFAGLGFQSFVFRSAAGQLSALGGYLSAYYVAFLLTIPAMALVAGLLYLALFQHTIGLASYVAIIAVEIVLWRLIELVMQINNGLGRYGAAAAVVSLSVAFRAGAAVAFWAQGGGHADDWAFYYLGGNAAALAVLGAVYHPRFRFRFRETLLLARLKDGALFAFSMFVFVAQSEIDKILVLLLAGERMAGIFAIAMRVIDLTAVPLRPVFVMYSRKLIQAGRARHALVRECLKVELGVALVSILGILAVVATLSVWPGLLGQNVSTALGMLAVIVAVPAFRNLLEFHAELFFAFDHMAVRALVAASLVVLKAASLALLLVAFAGSDVWAAWLNAIYGGIYAVSFAVVYRLLTRRTAS